MSPNIHRKPYSTDDPHAPDAVCLFVGKFAQSDDAKKTDTEQSNK